MTKAAMRYLDLHRHAAVRLELLKAPQVAVRLIAAIAIAGAGLWEVDPENQRVNGNKAIAASLEAAKAQQEFSRERQDVRTLLGLEPSGGHLMRAHWDAPDVCALFSRLLQLSDHDVLRVLVFVMAESLQAGSVQVETLGHLPKVDTDKWWTAARVAEDGQQCRLAVPPGGRALGLGAAIFLKREQGGLLRLRRLPCLDLLPPPAFAGAGSIRG